MSTVFKCTLDKEDVDGVHVAQDNDQCRSLVNTVMNLRVA